ncbi:phosphatidylinositol-specific phospholipase C/glycerophosphodiester phosphodiesterase family protein [Paenibacillus caui]|uniref:phosphatidylinositol-specific phospholipase C/glycerophosphodiester phosphodiesterase family protein n=1 Tax=Paenibacillus caui TaxID=2873927 RepID=UPI001F25DE97|nr:phosphatidylinositol-specific phospholipase C/glycerophosphodiester phosphodiesterase family protein [Paenibacillus caui]
MNRLLSLFGLAAAVLLLLLAGNGLIFNDQGLGQRQGFTQYRAISHAMGAINGKTHSNSYEAFIANYAKGNRLFEMDMLFSADAHLIGRHEWGASFSKMMGQQGALSAERLDARFTYDEFRKAKIDGKYDALTWEDAIELLRNYPDIYIVTDTKEIEPDKIKRMFETIVQTTEKVDPELLNRVVPQIYNESMLEQIQSIHAFPELIYTLYVSEDTDEQVVEFVRKNSISAVTMSNSRANRKLIGALKKLGVPSYVHTVNDKQDVLTYEAMGAYGFYSDSLSEGDLSKPVWKILLGL